MRDYALTIVEVGRFEPLRQEARWAACSRQFEQLVPTQFAHAGDECAGTVDGAVGQELDQRRGQQLVPASTTRPGQLQQAGGAAPLVPEDLVQAGVVDRDLPPAAGAVVDE